MKNNFLNFFLIKRLWLTNTFIPIHMILRGLAFIKFSLQEIGPVRGALIAPGVSPRRPPGGIKGPPIGSNGIIFQPINSRPRRNRALHRKLAIIRFINRYTGFSGATIIVITQNARRRAITRRARNIAIRARGTAGARITIGKTILRATHLGTV